MKKIDELAAEMLGKTFTSVTRDKENISFKNNNENYVFMHLQQGKEKVKIYNIIGDLGSLAGEPVTQVEMRKFEQDWPLDPAVFTRYNFSTIRGTVSVIWRGISDGRYPIEVDLLYTPETDTSEV